MFLIGSLFLVLGMIDWVENGTLIPYIGYEKLIIGIIFFIPGSYHTFLTIQAFRGIEGYTFEDLTAFEDENYMHNHGSHNQGQH